jgi:hypothetical protein
MRNRRLILLVALLAVSCRANSDTQSAPEGRAVHVVVCWLKTPGDSTARRRVIDESKAFVGVIPGLLDVSAGTTLPSTRPAVDSSFDVAVVMAFRDESALRAYDGHPRHKKAVDEVLRPLVARLVIYDFRVQ